MSDFGWTPQAAEQDRLPFREIVADEILYEYDGPRIFTVSSDGGHFLFYLSGSRASGARYIVAPCNQNIVDELRVGAQTVLEALDRGVVWVVDAGWDGAIRDVWRTVLARIPGKSLPKAGTMLLPGLQPALTLRYTGPAFEPGALKAGVLQATIQRAIDGFRQLGGREPVIQRLQVGSLELDFAAPEPSDTPSGLFHAEVAAGHRQSAFEDSLDMLDYNDGNLERLPKKHLRILNDLALPELSGLSRVEIGGRIFDRQKKFFIDEKKSQRIRDAISYHDDHNMRIAAASPPALRPEKVSGQIRRFDKDNLIFYLRRFGKSRSTKCSFNASLLNEALYLFAQDASVEVSGFSDGKTILVDSIRAIPSLPQL